MKFLNEQLFQTPEWMIDGDILGRIEPTGNMDRIRRAQTRSLDRLFNDGRMMRMIENEALNGSDAYSVSTLFYDLRRGIWSELRTGKKIDTYRRNLQKSHIDRLHGMLNSDNEAFKNSDMPSVARANLNSLKSEINKGISRQSGISRDHLRDCIERIDNALEGDD